MKLTFWGAAQQVTGSMHMLTLSNGYTILLDCGMNYEQKRMLHEEAFDFPFRPQDVDLVVLSHAHIDHSGNLPALVHRGFSGKILCTPATAALTKYLLFDSAHIQLMEYKQKLGRTRIQRRGLIPKPIYLDRQVEAMLDHLETIPFNQPYRVSEAVQITLVEAGHLLGAASIVIDVTENGKTKRIGFTGDLGRSNAELIRVPIPMQSLDYLITETTYGGRDHHTTNDAETELMKHITETVINQRGRLIIPAFSVGRTQSVVHVLNRLSKKGLLPPVKVFVDSPLAIRTSHVYENHPELLNESAKAFQNQYQSLFEFEGLHWIHQYDDHEQILGYTDPCIIVSAAGMVEGGRIQEHVQNNIQNPTSRILIAGFCAPSTLGHRLLQGQRSIQIKGRQYPVYASIQSTDVFSSHPGKQELLAYIHACEPQHLKQLFLVHGDETNLKSMQQTLLEMGIQQVEIPAETDAYTI
ncbi:MAG: MBL fold metallo-hydrolase [Bacteroidia bacterium]|jgi:metallo-beta-lactamase family protein|nr:MBL fold metallo-hydrolase [Bacteroidia bacterium]